MRFGEGRMGGENQKSHFTRDIIPIDWVTQQIHSELEQFQRLLADSWMGKIIEIGSAEGGTAALWALIGTQVISVDVAVREKVYKGVPEIESKVVEVIGNSHYPDTIEKVGEILDGSKASLLFIDGDHTTPGAELDFINYKQFVGDGGFVAFHDISELLPVLWGHIQNQYKRSWDIRHVTGLKHNGIGVIRYDSRIVYEAKWNA